MLFSCVVPITPQRRRDLLISLRTHEETGISRAVLPDPGCSENLIRMFLSSSVLWSSRRSEMRALRPVVDIFIQDVVQLTMPDEEVYSVT